AVEEKLETEFQLQSRPPENDAALADYVRSGHALPSQSDAGAHLNTNYCTAGETSWVLGAWVRERGLLSLVDAIRRSPNRQRGQGRRVERGAGSLGARAGLAEPGGRDPALHLPAGPPHGPDR